MHDSLRNNSLRRSILSSAKRVWKPQRSRPASHQGEHIMGVVRGHHQDGYVMLLATDRRVVFVDKKPLFAKQDELTYDVVSGVSMSTAGFGSTVTLHTKVKDYTIRTFNEKCAAGFVSYIESRRLEHSKGEER